MLTILCSYKYYAILRKTVLQAWLKFTSLVKDYSRFQTVTDVKNVFHLSAVYSKLEATLIKTIKTSLLSIRNIFVYSLNIFVTIVTYNFTITITGNKYSLGIMVFFFDLTMKPKSPNDRNYGNFSRSGNPTKRSRKLNRFAVFSGLRRSAAVDVIGVFSRRFFWKTTKCKQKLQNIQVVNVCVLKCGNHYKFVCNTVRDKFHFWADLCKVCWSYCILPRIQGMHFLLPIFLFLD